MAQVDGIEREMDGRYSLKQYPCFVEYDLPYPVVGVVDVDLVDGVVVVGQAFDFDQIDQTVERIAVRFVVGFVGDHFGFDHLSIASCFHLGIVGLDDQLVALDSSNLGPFGHQHIVVGFADFHDCVL